MSIHYCLSYLSNRRRGHIICPECSKDFPIPQDGFPTNFALQHVLDSLQETIAHLPLPVSCPHAADVTDPSRREVVCGPLEFSNGEVPGKKPEAKCIE